MMKIAVVGNCQAPIIAKVLSGISPDITCFALPLNITQLNSDTTQLLNFKDYDIVFLHKVQDGKWGEFSCENAAKESNVKFIPTVLFLGSHPDSTYIQSHTGGIRSPFSNYHSSIIVNSYLNSFSENDCFDLFTPAFFKTLGYDAAYDNSLPVLASYLKSFGLNGDYLVQKWSATGHFMHTVNHPKLFVLEDLTKSLCEDLSLPYSKDVNISSIMPDSLLNNAVFPIYPSLGRCNSSEESLLFKVVPGLVNKLELLSLRELITLSYKRYETVENLCDLIAKKKKDVFIDAVNSYNSNTGLDYFLHPYRNLPPGNYWSKAVAGLEMRNVDPATNLEICINPKDKVATAGSCFAQHIARTLSSSGMNYFVPETGPEGIDSETRKEMGYGLFSGRYGNIYTPRQLLQLFDRAYGQFEPTEQFWRDKDGYYLDPFRPNIGEKFTSFAHLQEDKVSHYERVRQMFEELDYFIFTLGLTEAWENVIDGSIYPVAPGVISKNEDFGQYRFVNFDYEDVKYDLEKVISRIKFVNNSAKIILTVSPVPLIATKESRHVLSSTIASKSILRAAADKISKTYDFVKYFPSYEIITGNFNLGSYYAKDLRSVVESGVDHVMHLFMRHCTSLTTQDTYVATDYRSTKCSDVIAEEFEQLAQVVCDEELLI